MKIIIIDIYNIVIGKFHRHFTLSDGTGDASATGCADYARRLFSGTDPFAVVLPGAHWLTGRPSDV